MSLDFVLGHLAGEGVAVDAERVGGLGQAAVAVPQDAGNEPLFELLHGVLELDAPVDHLVDEFLQPFGDHWSSRPVSRRKASTYFSRVLATTSSGSDGTGGCLFHRIRSRESRTNCLSKLGCAPPGRDWSLGQNPD